MNNQKQNALSLFIAIILFLSILGVLSDTIGNSNGLIIRCGLTETLTETKEALEGFQRFISSISAVFKEISSIAGFRAIVLLISVLFLAAVFSFIGIPKGKINFFLSLITANALWLLWAKSFNKPNEYIITIVKTNIILFIPVIAFLILKRLLPFIYSGVKSKLYRTFNLFRRRLHNKKNMIENLKRYQDCSTEFEKSLIEDIFHATDENITLSQNTNKSLRELDEIVKLFKL
jgi:hypothetical protein